MVISNSSFKGAIMNVKARNIEGVLNKMASWFPVLSVTGPRQSGKSTLVQKVFKDYEYINFEDPFYRQQAIDDPKGFLKNRAEHLIIDEAQLVPELFSIIQILADERKTTGQYVLTGSQNFLLLEKIQQSLAGRVGILKLLPFSYSEANRAGYTGNVDEFMFKGGYPGLYNKNVPANFFFDSYIETYVNRDVSGQVNPTNLSVFRKLLQLCALNAGNIINISALSSKLQISRETTRKWVSILNASYIIFELPPYFANVSKRLMKQPKLYFYDTGLLCRLLRIGSLKQLLTSKYLGQVFENLIVVELVKKYFNKGEKENLCFYRDDSKMEVDIVDVANIDAPQFYEVKSSETFRKTMYRTMNSVCNYLDVGSCSKNLVMRIPESFTSEGVSILSAESWAKGLGVN